MRLYIDVNNDYFARLWSWFEVLQARIVLLFERQIDPLSYYGFQLSHVCVTFCAPIQKFNETSSELICNHRLNEDSVDVDL